jgi:acetyl-CoA C-acetyltransferase
MANLVYLSGAAMTQFGRSKDSLKDLMVEAGLAALADAGLEKVDSLYMGVMNPAEFTGDSNLAALLADELDLPGVPSSRVETASSTGAGALETAFYAVASGYIGSALVVAGEKMTHLPTAQTTRILARVIDRVERQYGASMPALAAMICRRYAYEYGLSEEDLSQALASVAIKNHANGSLNPLAQFRKAINSEKYMRSKMVADPLRIYDCAPITDGAAAVVLTSDSSELSVVGVGHATDTLAVGRRGKLTSFNSTKQAALKAYRMAQISPKEVDLAEIHDAFTIFEMIGTEDLGFFDHGAGWKAVIEGRTSRDGELPVNASGGLKSRGHPVGASGLAQVVELAWQMRGELSKERQLNKVDVGLAQSIGGLANNNLVTILKRTDKVKVWQVKFEPDYKPELFDPKPFLELSSLKLGRAKLITWTVLHTPPEGFEPPLTLGYVQLGDGAVILAHGDVEKKPALGSKVSVDVAGEHFVFRPYDSTKRIWEQIDGLRKTVIGWWDAVEGAATQATRDRKAAKLKEARRKKRERQKEETREKEAQEKE